MSMNEKEIESYILSVVRKNPQGFFLKSFSKALSGYSKTRVTMQEKDFFGELSDYSVSEVESIINNMIDKKLLITGDYKGKIKIFAPQKIKSNPLDTIIKLIDSGENIFITGGGGVGKSYLLNQLKEHYGEELAITSTTGVSAYNINGQTIHSFAGIYKNKIYLSFPDTKRKLTRNLKEYRIIAIDEISMLHKETLDSLNSAFKEITGFRNKPFGGIQMIFIGDFFQLPPVPQKTSRSNFKSKKAEYCFKSRAWDEGNFITIDLQEVKRQSDKTFISALNKVRIGNITQDVVDLFEERERKFNIKTDSKTLCIFSKKYKMNKHNDTMLKKDENCCGEIIPYVAEDFYCETVDEKKSPDCPITADESANKEYLIAKAILERECRYPEEINLRNGCRVMLLRNLDQENGLVNGSCGVVKSHSEDEVVVKFDKIKEEQVITKHSFKFQYRYIEDENTGQIIKKAVKRVQFPLQLAYAITIHKSQGMTFDNLVVDLENVFNDGMSYVALSRNRTLENLYIKHFKSEEIKTSQEVIDFYNNLKNCITFTEDGEMIENFGKDLETDDNDIESSSSDKIIAAKTYETEDDSYDDEIEVNKYFESNNYEYSIDPIEYYSNKIISDPSNCEYLNYRAEAYYENKEYDFALNDWNKILEIEPEYVINYFKKACSEHKMKNYQNAIEDYTEYLKYNPDCAAAHYNCGLAQECHWDCNYKDALYEYNEAIRLAPDNCQYLNSRARVYYWNDDFKKAVNDWDKILEINSEYKIDYSRKMHAESELAGAYYDNGDYEKAVNLWNKILKVEPEYDIDYFDKAYAESEIEQYDNAISDYTVYINNNPDSSSAYNNRGVCEYNKKNYERAINDYSDAIRLDPDDCKCRNNRADAYYWNNEYENAIKDWNNILKIDSEYPIYYYEKAYAENEIGMYEDALLSIENYLNENSDNEKALKLKNTISDNLSKNNNEKTISEYIKNAESYYESEEYEKAVDEWHKVLEINPEYEIDYFKKAYAEDKIENYDQAIADYTKYLENNPNDAVAYNNRGWAKECSDNYSYEDAIEDYNKAIELESDETMYLNNRARAYYKNRNYKNAKVDYLKLLELDIDEKKRQEIKNKLQEIEKILSAKVTDKSNENKKNDNVKNWLRDNLDKKISKANEKIKKGNYSDAVAICDEILEYDTYNVEANWIQGNAYFCNGNITAAEEKYNEALKLDKKCGKAWLNLGLIKEKQQFYNTALEYYKKAISMGLSKEHKEIAEQNINNVQYYV